MRILSNYTNIISLPKLQEYSYVELILFNLNYSFKKLRRRRILFSVQYEHDGIIKLPDGVLGRTFKRRLILYGPPQEIARFIVDLSRIRQPNIHTGKGLRMRHTSYQLKARKRKPR